MGIGGRRQLRTDVRQRRNALDEWDRAFPVVDRALRGWLEGRRANDEAGKRYRPALATYQFDGPVEASHPFRSIADETLAVA